VANLAAVVAGAIAVNAKPPSSTAAAAGAVPSHVAGLAV